MQSDYANAVAQIESSTLSSPLYRTARRLLDLATLHGGEIELSPSAAKSICETMAFGTVRSHAIALAQAGIITYRTSQRGVGYLRVRFTAYPSAVIESWPLDENMPASSTNGRAGPPSPKPRRRKICLRFQQMRASDQQMRASGQQIECTTTTEEEDLLLLDSRSSSSVVQKTEQHALVGLACEMLEECGIFPNDARSFAKQHRFEYLRQWVFDWRNNPRSQGPGLLKHIISHNFRRGELTSEDRGSDFYQRYRTPDEIEADRLAELAFGCGEQDELSAPLLGPEGAPRGYPPLGAEEEIEHRHYAPVCSDPDAIVQWGILLAEFELQLPAATFNAWVRNMWVIDRICDGDGDLWVIGLLDRFALDWVQNRLANKIKRTLSSLVRHNVQLEFRVGAAP